MPVLLSTEQNAISIRGKQLNHAEAEICAE